MAAYWPESADAGSICKQSQRINRNNSIYLQNIDEQDDRDTITYMDSGLFF